jgi:hypothetical protein
MAHCIADTLNLEADKTVILVWINSRPRPHGEATAPCLVRFMLNAGVRFSEASKLTPEQLSKIPRKVAKAMCENKPE